MPMMDAIKFGMVLQQEEESRATTTTDERPPAMVAVVIMELPFGNTDVRLLADYLLRSSPPQDRDYQLISANPNATLSGMPAYEAVAASLEPEESRIKSYIVMTIQGDRAYGVAYESQESTFEQFLPIARNMISRFTIVQ